MVWEKTGVKYLKSGDESGHLCFKCDYPMIIIKKRVANKFSKGKKIMEWSIRCQCCGREVPTKMVRYAAVAEVYI